jgi:8-oxo-dGTP diphosphatase
LTADIKYKMWTLCMIRKNDKVLMINRTRDFFKGFLPPGGKVEFPESIVEGAIREVQEETGLKAKNLVYKGLYEYVNPTKRDRYMIFNYITTDFEGELMENPPEGELKWIEIDELSQVPMQTSIKRRIPLFFEEGTFEIQVVWDEETNSEKEVTIRRT